jgi:hypothetical protein
VKAPQRSGYDAGPGIERGSRQTRDQRIKVLVHCSKVKRFSMNLLFFIGASALRGDLSRTCDLETVHTGE